MTGWIKAGEYVTQREKIYALIRVRPKTVYEIIRACWESGDKTVKNIKSPAVRRCLQELRDNIPQMASKDPSTERWAGFGIKV